MQVCVWEAPIKEQQGRFEFLATSRQRAKEVAEMINRVPAFRRGLGGDLDIERIKFVGYYEDVEPV